MTEMPLLLRLPVFPSRMPPSDIPDVLPEELMPGDVLASNRSSLMSSMIRGVTASWCSHLALYVGHGEIVEAEYRVNEVVKRVWISAMLSEQRRGVALRLAGLGAEQRLRIAAAAIARVGRPYDFAGAGLAGTRDVFPAAVPDRGAEDGTRYFCSELVFSSYRAAGVVLSSTRDSILSPAEFIRLAWGNPRFAILGRFGR